MFNRISGVIGAYLEKKKLLGIYSEEQRQALRALEDHYMTEMDHEWQSSASLPSSTHSPSVGSDFRPQPIVGYFESLEKRFGQEEYFKKEEFDL